MDNEKFIRRINERGLDAYKELYDRYYRTLVVYAANFIEDGDVGEDIVQEIIVNIWENKMTFASYAAFNAYLYNAVRNASLNHLKHQGVADKYMEYLAHAYSPIEEESVNEEEIYRLLFELIDKLPLRCREIFLLYMEGKRNEEIAGMLSLSVETVKTKKKRAMAFIRENLDKALLVSLAACGGEMWIFEILNLG